MDYKKYIANIPDFPQKGIIFRDITPLMQDGQVFRSVIADLAAYAERQKAEVIVGPESRGFLFGAPVAEKLGIGFVPVRKPGKLPRKSITASYSLEYGENTLCLHEDALKPGARVVIIDDLIATGGTTKATAELVERLGGIVVGIAFVIELPDCKGRETLKNYDVMSLVSFAGA